MTSSKAAADSSTTPARLLTVSQVAEALQTSTRTIQRFVSSGDLSAVRIGRLVRIRPAALEAFLNNVTESDRGRR